MNQKTESKRSIIVVKNNGEENKKLSLSKATLLDDESLPGMIHLDELKDGTWRLTFTKKTIGDISTINSLNILRENFIDKREIRCYFNAKELSNEERFN